MPLNQHRSEISLRLRYIERKSWIIVPISFIKRARFTITLGGIDGNYIVEEGLSGDWHHVFSNTDWRVDVR